MNRFKFLPLIFLLIISCSKEKVNIKPNADFTIIDEIDHFVLSSNSNDSDGNEFQHQWISMCDTIDIVDAYSSTAYFNLPKISESKQFTVKYVVSDGLESDSMVKEITLPKITLERIYGLGINLEKEQSNNINYSWYFDQLNTGTYSYENCGPTAATMAIKWADENYNKNPEDARNIIRPYGGWWYTYDIMSYLNSNSINNYTIEITQIDLLQEHIDIGNIAILCIDVFYIKLEENSKWHIDRYYKTSYDSGHFIIIKGYKIVDGKVYYEVYDPNSWGMEYSEGILKGVDRYYRSEDLNGAVLNWWNYAIIVTKDNLKNSNYGVDINKIVHKPGF